jgi:hypothetical protein
LRSDASISGQPPGSPFVRESLRTASFCKRCPQRVKVGRSQVIDSLLSAERANDSFARSMINLKCPQRYFVVVKQMLFVGKEMITTIT